MRARKRFKSILIVLGLLLSACSSSGGPSPAASAPLSTPQNSILASQLQPINASLNSSANYALTPADVSLLQMSGVLQDGDTQALSPLIKN